MYKDMNEPLNFTDEQKKILSEVMIRVLGEHRSRFQSIFSEAGKELLLKKGLDDYYIDPYTEAIKMCKNKEDFYALELIIFEALREETEEHKKNKNDSGMQFMNIAHEKARKVIGTTYAQANCWLPENQQFDMEGFKRSEWDPRYYDLLQIIFRLDDDLSDVLIRLNNGETIMGNVDLNYLRQFIIDSQTEEHPIKVYNPLWGEDLVTPLEYQKHLSPYRL